MTTAIQRGFEAYKIYVAMKTHFSREDYNFFNYNGKTNANVDSFRKRKDRYFFIRFARKYPIQKIAEMILANMLYDSKFWIGDMTGVKPREIYSAWKRKIDALSYVFDNDSDKFMVTMLENKDMTFDDFFKMQDDGQHPLIMIMLQKKFIEIESFMIINELVDFFPQFDIDMKDDIVWQELKRKCTKYKPFLLKENGPLYNTDKYRKVLQLKIQKFQKEAEEKNGLDKT